MSSLAREKISKALLASLHNRWCCASLATFVAVASFLSTGLLWPAAAILSSFFTSLVQGYLEKQTQLQRPAGAHSERLKETHLGTFDENAHGSVLGESMASSAIASDKEVVIGREDSVKTVTQSSVNIGEPLAKTRLDHVSISLKRSESEEDWGFAWQVGAYGAKRLILVDIGSSSPMDLSNASRQAYGQPAIASGDELVSVNTHTEFGAMQKALGSATSLELTFLKAHAVKPVLLSAVRREKKRLSIERNRVAFSLLEVTSQAVGEARQNEEGADAPSVNSNTIMREAVLPFDTVVTTKNTFVDFRAAENDHMERFAHSDPTPMLSCTSPTFSSSDDQTDEAETMSADNLSASLDESDSSYSHFDTMDIQELVKQMPKENRSLLSEVQPMEGVDASSTCHFDTMDLQQQTASPEIVPHDAEIPHSDRSSPLEVQMKGLEGSSKCNFDTIDLQQHAAVPETPHFDTIDLHDFKEEANCFNGSPYVKFADRLTPQSVSIELLDSLEPLQNKAKKKPIHLANLLMEPEIETSFIPNRSGSFEQARSLEFHSSRGSCFANNLGSDAEPRLLLPRSNLLGTQHCNSLAYQHESPLRNHCYGNALRTGSFRDARVPSLETKKNCKPKQKQKSTRTVIQPAGEDWYCPVCFDLQFAANLKCRRCGLLREHGVTELEHLDADRFLEGHNVTTNVAARFQSLAPNLQQAVMSGGSLHGARDPSAVLSNRIRKAEALASTAPSREFAPITLGFDRKQKRPTRHFPAGGDPSD